MNPEDQHNLPRFSLCEECLSKYRALQFNPKAKLRQNHIPFATIMWSDEHPGGLPHPICKNETCFASISLLIAARSEYWEHGTITTKYAKVWDAAKEMIPLWPGFQRLLLSKRQQHFVDVCLQSAENFFSALSELSGGKVESREVTPGISEWSATIDLKNLKDDGNANS